MKKLNAFCKAFELKQKMLDEKMWIMGVYVQCAVSTAVEHNLAGKKAKSKYLKKPLMKEVEEKKQQLSEEELQKQRELFMTKLMLMKTNYDLNKENDRVS